MTPIPVIHDTFTVERLLNAPPSRVFEAFADEQVKARWFSGPPSWTQVERAFDFRVGGQERLHGRFENGMTSLFTAHYLDIVPKQRVVYAYEMVVNGRKISASLATLQLFPEGDRTRLVLTEQGAYFHDPDMASYAPDGQARSRLMGTNALMDKVAALFNR
jgi:uncharacterized protein YndB with AHSA1/START domain